MAYDDLVDASHPANPSPLPSRYQIRRLIQKDKRASAAILCHSNIFHSTVFTKVYPDNLGQRFNDLVASADGYLEHCFASGLSYGVFDTEFPYKHESSRAAGGAFLWSPNDPPSDSASLLAAMDFPLVSIALSHDEGDPLQMIHKAPLVEVLPVFATADGLLEEREPHGAAYRESKELGVVLKRSGTSTRLDYEGKGLMGGAARWLMREAQLRGYKTILIDAFNDAVTHVWTHPKQKGMSGEIVSEFNAQDMVEKKEDGTVIKLFGTSTQRVTRAWVKLDV